MANENDVIGSIRSGRVHAGLDPVIELLSALVLTETVDIVSVCILEIRRSGFRKAFRCAGAHQGNLRISVCHHLVRGEYGLSCAQIQEVTGIVAAAQFPRQFQETGHTVIEFMVSRYGEVIANLIHDID